MLTPSILHAEDQAWQQWCSLKTFREICVEIAPRVDLFHSIWEADPHAMLYGGTSRDFVWFVRGELSKAVSKEDFEARVRALKSRPIEVKEFIVGQSDVDIVSNKDLSNVSFDKDLVTRIERIGDDRFRPGNALYEQEKLQGYVPTEKILLHWKGFQKVKGLDQGDGVAEIYSGRPTVHFDPRIKDTAFYKTKNNHPVLLALRYLRQVAVAYYRLYGKELPTAERMAKLIDKNSAEAVQKVFDDINADPDELKAYLANDPFRGRLNKLLAKAFRSYTNPNAAKKLFERFGVDKALERYGDRIDPYHTLMYRKYRNEADLVKQREQLGFERASYLEPVESYFKGKGLEPFVYHGTPTMENYRNIVFQGNIASEGGVAGKGVYAVDSRSLEFAKTWRRWSESKEPLVVQLNLDPKALVVDITEGKGKEAFEKFLATGGKLRWFFDGRQISPAKQDEYSAFADFVGADLVRYPYGSTMAYVIKNGGAVLGQKGITIPLMTIYEAREDLRRHHFSVERFSQLAGLDPGLIRHWDYLSGSLPETEKFSLLLKLMNDSVVRLALPHDILTHPIWRNHEAELRAIVSERLKNEKTDVTGITWVGKAWSSLPESIALELYPRLLQSKVDGLIRAAVRRLVAMPDWPEPVWKEVLQWLDNKWDVNLHDLYGDLLLKIGKLERSTEGAHSGSLAFRALRAARLSESIADWDVRGESAKKKLDRVFGLSPDELEAAKQWLALQKNRSADYAALKKVKDRLNITLEELAGSDPLYRVTVYNHFFENDRAILSTEAWRKLYGSLAGEMRDRLRTWLTQDLTMHDEVPVLLSIPDLMYGADHARFLRDFLHNPENATYRRKQPLFVAAYHIKPDLFSASEWKAIFHRINADAREKPAQYLRSGIIPATYSESLEKGIADLLAVPEPFQDPIVEDLLSDSPSTVVKNGVRRAVARVRPWSTSVWRWALEHLADPPDLSDPGSYKMENKRRLWQGFASRPIPKEIVDGMSRIERIHTAAKLFFQFMYDYGRGYGSDKLETVRDKIFRELGTNEEEWKAIEPLLPVALREPPSPEALKRAREALRFELKDLLRLHPRSAAYLFREMFEHERHAYSEEEWKSTAWKINDALLKEIPWQAIVGESPKLLEFDEPALRAMLAMPEEYLDPPRIEAFQRNSSTLRSVIHLYVERVPWSQRVWREVMAFLSSDDSFITGTDPKILEGLVKQPWPASVWHKAVFLLRHAWGPEIPKFLFSHVGAVVMLLEALAHQPVWTTQIWNEMAQLLEHGVTPQIQELALKTVQSQKSWPPRIVEIVKGLTQLEKFSAFADTLHGRNEGTPIYLEDSCSKELGEIAPSNRAYSE